MAKRKRRVTSWVTHAVVGTKGKGELRWVCVNRTRSGARLLAADLNGAGWADREYQAVKLRVSIIGKA